MTFDPVPLTQFSSLDTTSWLYLSGALLLVFLLSEIYKVKNTVELAFTDQVFFQRKLGISSIYVGSMETYMSKSDRKRKLLISQFRHTIYSALQTFRFLSTDV